MVDEMEVEMKTDGEKEEKKEGRVEEASETERRQDAIDAGNSGLGASPQSRCCFANVRRFRVGP